MTDKVYRPNWRPEWREKFSDYQQYAKVYKDAVEVLLTNLKNTGFDHDCQNLPLMFLFRHYIELELKGLIFFCCTIDPDIKEKLNDKATLRHNLFTLLQGLEKIKIRHIEIKFSKEFKDFIKRFNELDKEAIRFRYPETTKLNMLYENDLEYNKDKPFFDELMDLNKITIKIEMVISELNKLSSYLYGEKENLFETLQWEQDNENS